VQRARLANAITGAMELLATQQAELDKVGQQRGEEWSELQTLDSHRIFLGEQIKRLELLRKHYDSDAARLESTLEAGELMERLPRDRCPVCGQIAPSDDPDASDVELRKFQAACRAELAKIAALARDLEISVVSCVPMTHKMPLGCNCSAVRSLKATWQLVSYLPARSKRLTNNYLVLIERQNHLSQAAFIANELTDLRDRYQEIERQCKQKVKTQQTRHENRRRGHG